MRIFAVFSIGLVSVSSWAQEPRIKLLFGPEEEYRSQAMNSYNRKSAIVEGVNALTSKEKLTNIDTRHIYSYKLDLEEIDRLMVVMKKNCQQWQDVGCRWIDLEEGAKIYYRDGKVERQYHFTYDHGVMELKSTPFELENLEGKHGEYYSRILKTLRKEGWETAKIGGEGHLHIDIDSAFRLESGEYDLKRFRNFFMDWVNHNELSWGILHYDPKADGANPLIRDLEMQQHYEGVFKKWDQVIAEKGSIVSKSAFMEQVTMMSRELTKGDSISIRSSLGTIEIRSLRPKQNLEEMKRICRLLESRVNYLAKLDRLLPYYGGIAPKNVQEAVNRFYLYVTESGESWNDMKKLMPGPWRLISPRRDAKLEELYSSGKYKVSKGFECQAWLFNHLLRF